VGANEQGFKQYGYLKNRYSTSIRLLIKDNGLKIFSKARIAESIVSGRLRRLIV
jgi:hypothetical protein